MIFANKSVRIIAHVTTQPGYDFLDYMSIFKNASKVCHTIFSTCKVCMLGCDFLDYVNNFVDMQ